MKTLPLLFLAVFALGCASADPFRGSPVQPSVLPNPVYTTQGPRGGLEESREDSEGDSLRVAVPISPLPVLVWGEPGMIPADPEVVFLCPCGCRGWTGALDRRGSGRFLWVWKLSRWGGVR